jgi:hypothetical protein
MRSIGNVLSSPRGIFDSGGGDDRVLVFVVVGEFKRAVFSWKVVM